MAALYKYCAGRHMRAMLTQGSARIGTLSGWRATGAHGEMSSDEFEGVIQHRGNLIFYDPSNIDAFDYRPEDSIVTVEGEGANELRHFTNHVIRSSDLYTFSTSSTYSEEQHRRWLLSEGYDACYRIANPPAFFRALSTAMPFAEFRFVEPVIYVPDRWENLEIPGKFHPALLKRAGGYDDQREVRALWRPLDHEALSPRIIERSKAGIYVEVYRTL